MVISLRVGETSVSSVFIFVLSYWFELRAWYFVLCFICGKAQRTKNQVLNWCERGDSNPHTSRYQILSLARLPIPPLSRLNLRVFVKAHIQCLLASKGSKDYTILF